jgi:thymidylate synthase (FAD)
MTSWEEMVTVKLIDHMGTDATVANVARVSLGRSVEEVGPSEVKLIEYLIKHQHTSPLRHCFASFHIVAPIFVLRQWGKHQVGCSWNEISYRYVEHDAERHAPWNPDIWRGQGEGIKQGSAGALELQGRPTFLYEQAVDAAMDTYTKLIELGVCREQARAVLPQATQSEVIWTASLHALLHFLELRTAPTAQYEIRQYAQQVADIVAELWPITLSAWHRCHE